MTRTPVLAFTLCLLLPAAPAPAQSLDYEVFKSQIEPIFLKKRGDHVRCVVCHSERSAEYRLKYVSVAYLLSAKAEERVMHVKNPSESLARAAY